MADSKPSTIHALVSRGVPALAILALVGVGGVMAMRSERSAARAELYQERLRELATRYTELADVYNVAVRKTAVTELVVADRTLTVRVRTADGVLLDVPTPYNPASEIYVDYAVLDGRVWIRRVFDEHTAPSEATVIDPKLADIDWDLEGLKLGKAVYRSLSDGRWVVSVSGNGSLGLTRLADGAQDAGLIHAPAVVEFEQIEAQVDEQIDRITSGQLLARVFGG
ncbi:MAG: hypothetical protein ACI89L_001954 [Phycisphaerales bacterium]|jgi:hypothetical protein